MSATILALLWCVAGATRELVFHEQEGEGYNPWWLTALNILSWPLLLAPQFFPMQVEISVWKEDE